MVLKELYSGIYDGRELYLLTTDKEKLIWLPKQIFTAHIAIPNRTLSEYARQNEVSGFSALSFERRELSDVIRKVCQFDIPEPLILAEGTGMRDEPREVIDAGDFKLRYEKMPLPQRQASKTSTGLYFVLGVKGKEKTEKVYGILRQYGVNLIQDSSKKA